MEELAVFLATILVNPAMEAGLSNHVWTIEELTSSAHTPRLMAA